MKHGDKKKGKASKAAGKKSSKASKSSKVVKSAKAKSSASKSSKKTSKPRENGAAARGRGTGDVSFSNPTVGAAFRHAIKKYSNAFRKLTD